MAQAKHTFVESKMNKDLDDRLLSGGQYRNAINVAVSKSEQSDVGALENVLGNYSINNFFPQSFTPPPQLDIIGWYLSDTDNTIFVFLTNYTDPNNPESNISQPATTNSSCYINQYNIITGAASILVEGSFLNFSTSERISGVNLIEDFLFWTDNRNQPRKINVKTAFQNTNNSPRYYISEDTISVAKYNPYIPIDVQKTTTVVSGSPITILEVNPAGSGAKVGKNLTLEIYNDTTLTYGSQDCLNEDSYDGGAGWSTPSGIVFFQLGLVNLSNIPIYTWFIYQGQLGQVYAKEAGSIDGFYALGSFTSGGPASDTIVFLESNIRDTTSSHLPPSGRLKVTNMSSSVSVTVGEYEGLGSAAAEPANLKVEWLSGGDEFGAGQDTYRSSLPLGLFGPLRDFATERVISGANDPTYLEDTRGLKLTDSQGNQFWESVKITSNHFSTDDIRCCFFVDDTLSVAGQRSFYGKPLKNNGGGATNWDVFFSITGGMEFPAESVSYFDFALPNPYYNPTWAGDKQNLKEKFVRFAYRFKFDDNEYSLVSPFTQTMFIPEQDGYFYKDTPIFNQGKSSTLINQLEQAGKSTIVDWFENKGTEFTLDIPLEYPVNELNEKLKVVEVDILYKESDGLALKVVDSIDFTLLNSEIASNSTNTFSYVYNSAKPYKVLPENVLTRTSDKVPIRALAQETSGNRIMYGNFIDKHSSPSTLKYSASVGPKFAPQVGESNDSWLQYPNHTLKQNRSYQIGVVLTDRYGRQSDVIVAEPEDSIVTYNGIDFSDSTIYHKYKDETFVSNQDWNLGLLGWKGDSLKVLFEDVIPENIADRPGYPGLYNGDITSSQYNPLGYFTYKIVVKQKQQDYYNVYLPSLLWGQPVKAPITLNWVGDNPLSPNLSNITVTGSDKMYGVTDANLLSPGMSFVLTQPGTVNTYNFTVTKIVDSTTIQFSPAAQVDFWGGWTEPLSAQFGQATVLFSYQNTYSTDVYLPDSMSTTLLSDNINKIPPDLETIRPNQTMYRTSDLEIIPRVARSFANQIEEGTPTICTIDYTAQLFPGLSTENVDVLGNFNDIIGENDNLPTGLYDQSKNPVLAILSNKLQIGSAITDESYPAVFETAPTTSELDIFWESGTSGLISELNQDIITGPAPTSILGLGFTQNEEIDYDATPAVIWSFSMLDALGGIVTQGTVVDVTLAAVNGVVDGNGVDVTADYSFTAGSPSSDIWSIETNKSTIFKEDQAHNQRIFTFIINMVGGQTFTLFSQTFSIINSSPVIANQTGQIPPTGIGITPFPGFADFTLDIADPRVVSINPETVPVIDNSSAQYRISGTNGSGILTWPTVGDDQYDEVAYSLAVRTADDVTAPLFSQTNPTAGFGITELVPLTNNPPYVPTRYGLTFTWDANLNIVAGTEMWIDWRLWDCNNAVMQNSKLYTQVASGFPSQTLIKVTYIDSLAPEQVTFTALAPNAFYPTPQDGCFGYPGNSGQAAPPIFTNSNDYDFSTDGGIILIVPGECT